MHRTIKAASARWCTLKSSIVEPRALTAFALCRLYVIVYSAMVLVPANLPCNDGPNNNFFYFSTVCVVKVEPYTHSHTLTFFNVVK